VGDTIVIRPIFGGMTPISPLDISILLVLAFFTKCKAPHFGYYGCKLFAL